MGELVLKEKNLNSICDTMNGMNGDNLNWDAISEDILRINTQLSCPSPLLDSPLVPGSPPVNVEDANYICAIGYDERGRRIESRELDTHPVSYTNQGYSYGKMKRR